MAHAAVESRFLPKNNGSRRNFPWRPETKNPERKNALDHDFGKDILTPKMSEKNPYHRFWW